VKACGADAVINHRNNLKEELNNIGVKEVDYVFQCYKLDNEHIHQIAEVVRPFGKVVGILDKEKLDMGPFLMKVITFYQEFAAARTLYGVEIEKQGKILNLLSKMFDLQVLKPTVSKNFKFNLENLIEAESILEKGRSVGKITLDRVDEFCQLIK